MEKKKPYALLINDIHVSNDNITEFRANWNEAIEVAERNAIDMIIIGGDLWMSRSSQTLSTIMAAKEAMIKATSHGISVIMAEGNHDKVDQESLLGYCHMFSEYPDIEVIDDYAIYDMGESDLFVMSYFPGNGSFIERYKEMVKELIPGKKSILYIHQGIRGGLSTASDDELPASLFKDFDSVLVAHYHNRKKIPGTAIEYIGSSRQHNFGEDEEKGYTIVYSDGSYEFVKNEANTRYKVIEIDFKNLDNEFLQHIEALKKDPRYKIKVKINCKSKQASSIDKNKLVECGATKIELVTEQTQVLLSEEQDLSQKFNKSGIKQEYIKFCSEKSIDNKLGLQYLDKLK